MKERILAFIGARGGSKGLPGKNVKNLSGKPLINWTVEAALGCSDIDEVLVSTDSREILSAVKDFCNYETEYMRPDFLAADTSNVLDAVNHALQWLHAQGKIFDSVILLQPTSPLRNSDHIEKAIRSYKASNEQFKSLVSVYPVSVKYNWLMAENGPFIKFVQQDKIVQRQALGNLYLPNGAIYIAPISTENKVKTFFDQNIIPFLMTESESIDIDTLDDFLKAEQRMNDLKGYRL